MRGCERCNGVVQFCFVKGAFYVAVSIFWLSMTNGCIVLNEDVCLLCVIEHLVIVCFNGFMRVKDA